jgi:hypothetical protein
LFSGCVGNIKTGPRAENRRYVQCQAPIKAMVAGKGYCHRHDPRKQKIKENTVKDFKPCPFCNCTDLTRRKVPDLEAGPWYNIRCNHCGAEAPDFTWNKRITEDK